MFSHSKILVLVPLLFVALLNSIPSYLLNLLILVCLPLYMLSIHINLSAGTQNITGAYIIIMLVYRRLLTMVFTWQSSCVIANNKQFVQGYNLEVHDVANEVHAKTSCHCIYITCKPVCVMQ